MHYKLFCLSTVILFFNSVGFTQTNFEEFETLFNSGAMPAETDFKTNPLLFSDPALKELDQSIWFLNDKWASEAGLQAGFMQGTSIQPNGKTQNTRLAILRWKNEGVFVFPFRIGEYNSKPLNDLRDILPVYLGSLNWIAKVNELPSYRKLKMHVIPMLEMEELNVVNSAFGVPGYYVERMHYRLNKYQGRDVLVFRNEVMTNSYRDSRDNPEWQKSWGGISPVFPVCRNGTPFYYGVCTYSSMGFGIDTAPKNLGRIVNKRYVGETTEYGVYFLN